MAILEANNISKTYTVGTQRIKVLIDASLSVERGEFLVVEGESGSGKSTLLSVLSGLDKIDKGHVLIEGRNITNLSEDELAPLRNTTLVSSSNRFTLFLPLRHWKTSCFRLSCGETALPMKRQRFYSHGSVFLSGPPVSLTSCRAARNNAVPSAAL